MTTLTPEEELLKYLNSRSYYNALNYTVNTDGSFNIPDGYLTFYTLPKFVIHKTRGVN